MDHGETYNSWKTTKYKSDFAPFFSRLTDDPIIIRCPEDFNLFFMVAKLPNEIVIIFPGTRKTVQGNLKS